MAITATTQVLHEGVKNLVMQFTAVATTLNDETAVLKVNLATLTPRPTALAIRQIDYNVSGGLLDILWDAASPVVAVELTGASVLDYDRIGGMKNLAGVNATGGIKFTTIGFNTGSSYTVTLHMRKKY